MPFLVSMINRKGMKTLIQFISESRERLLEKTQNTVLSDINELKIGFFLSGNSWNKIGQEAKDQYDKRVAQAEPDEVKDAEGKARVMATEFQSWAKNHGYKGEIKKVYWTARPGSLSDAIGHPVDSRKNPTDILVQYADGPSGGFLGLSAKATMGSGDIGFKNPGVGTIDASLSLNLSQTYKDKLDITIKDLGLPASTDERKSFIRSNPQIKAKTEEIGTKLLAHLRDILYDKLVKFKSKELSTYIITNWMDADIADPPYIKVTGNGKKEPYTAHVTDPLNNSKLGALKDANLKLIKVGNDSIGVMGGETRIMKMRFKFESEKMASSMKMSGDPW